MIQSSASYGAIGGGYQNTIQSKADYATIPGGLNNVAGGNYSLAAGHNAKAGHLSAFVWADSSGGTFASSAANQFLIRAAGGVGIGITNPATALDVNGTVSATAFQGDGSGLTGVSFGGWSLNGN
jgi:hypothetical protein